MGKDFHLVYVDDDDDETRSPRKNDVASRTQQGGENRGEKREWNKLGEKRPPKYALYVAVLIVVTLALVFMNWGLFVIRDKQLATQIDVLVHHSTESLPVPFFLRGIAKFAPDLITGNQLLSRTVASETFGKQDLPAEGDNYSAPFWNNYRPHWFSEMSELWAEGNGGNYMAASRQKFKPIGRPEVFSFEHGDHMFVAPLERLDDRVKMRQVMYTQSWGGSYTAPNSYRALYAAMKFLRQRYPNDEFVISGDFNVHGHEAVVRKVFPDYLIADFSRMPTCFDNEGIASPDGVAISPRLYERIEYRTEFPNGESYQHMAIVVEMYRRTPASKNAGTHVSDKWASRNFTIEAISMPLNDDDRNLFDEPSKFDPNLHDETYDANRKSRFVTNTAEPFTARCSVAPSSSSSS